MKATTTKKQATAISKSCLPKSKASQELVPVVPPVGGYNAAAGLMAIIETAARNPRVNVDKMERLLNMQMTIMQKQAEMSYSASMTRLQEKLPRITKKGRIAFTDKLNNERNTPYAKYEDIDAVIKPLMKEEGFTISFTTKWGTDGATIFATLSHRDGHKETSEMRLPLDTSGSKNSLQAMGSTISYGQRYGVKMLLNLIFEDEDTDGGNFPKQATEGEAFTSRLHQDAGGTIIDGDVRPVAEGHVITGHQLKSDLLKLKTKKQRRDHINKNVATLHALDKAGDQNMVQQLHNLADQGA